MSSKRARKEDAAPAASSVMDRVAAIEAALASDHAALERAEALALVHNSNFMTINANTAKTDARVAKLEAAHADLSRRFFASNAGSQMLCAEVKQDFYERDETIKAQAARIEKLEAWMKTVCDREAAQQSNSAAFLQTMNDGRDQIRALYARGTGTPLRDLA